MKTHDIIRKVMMTKKSWKSYEIAEEVFKQFGKRYSESTITRRMREMGDIRALPPIDRSKSTAWSYVIV